MHEVATTLTDYALAVICLLATLRLYEEHRAGGLAGPLVFFAGFTAATFIGGTWHGFFSLDTGRTQEIVWWCAQLFAGVTALGLALAGLELVGVRRSRVLLLILLGLFVVYAVTTWRDPRFLWSLIATASATLLCAASLARQLRMRERRGAALVLAGLGISILAAIAQQRGVAIDPPAFDHNATYHLFLVPALALMYFGFRRLDSLARVPA